MYSLIPRAGPGRSAAGGFGADAAAPAGGIVTTVISRMTMRARRRLGGG